MRHISTVILFIFISGCTTVEVIDEWKNFKNHEWDKKQKVVIPVTISDTGFYYNLALNVRLTNDYKYSNLWVKLKITGPDSSSETKNHMLTLADHRGNWKGHNLGHIISFRLPVQKDLVFSKKGEYRFEMEQFMRDTVLKEMVSIGIKLDKKQEILK
ncbi:MAG: gliding motility lipoprotein GldH [Flavobacteriales bacterium]|nr:gliding motility lipoprotein GldH [Flavobacteriales bacterium]